MRRILQKPLRGLVAVTSLLLFSGCGYTLNHRLIKSFDKPQGVFIPVFDNNTDEVGAEQIFTNALIRELQSRGEPIVGSREDGGLELHGTITSINYTPTAYSAPGLLGLLKTFQRIPTEVGVGVQLVLILSEPKTGKVLWNKTFSGFRRVATPLNRTYDADATSSLGQQTLSLIQSEYEQVARNIMRDVYDEMVELF